MSAAGNIKKKIRHTTGTSAVLAGEEKLASTTWPLNWGQDSLGEERL